MAVALDKFVKLLEESGLIPREELAALLADIPAPRKADGEQLARELVKRKKLTAYQAQEVYAGRGKKLVLGNYVIQDKLGQGGMGMVLKAEHRRMERIVALKVMSKAAVESPEAVKRFHREVKAAAKLTHPNIVTAHDADEANGTHFLVMEFVEGTDLSQLVKKNGPLAVEKAVTCILQAARGLEFAHEHGIVHRDIKPANLLLDAKGHVKILDMGLARIDSVGGDQAELTGTGQIMGTVDYMAPEQAMNTKKADHRADIYSLGITLWYLLTGKAAYAGDTVMEKLMAHQSGPIPSLSELRQDVPPALEAVFRKMVAKTVGERHQSMSEVIAALERSRSGGGGDVSPTITLPSEDAKLSEFLKGMGPVQPSRSSVSPAVATAPSAPSSPVAPSTAAELEQTIVTSTPQTDTDPQTQTNLHASSLAPPPPPPAPPAPPAPTPASPRAAPPPLWWANPPMLIGAGTTAVVLLLVATWAIFFRGGNEAPPAKGPGGVPPVKVAKVTPPDFVPLFNRKDLAGWKTHPGYAGDWRVEKGVLLGSCSGRLFTYLFSERGDYGDFHLRAETRVASGTSAGITARAPFPTPGPNVPRPVPGYLGKINADSAADPRKTGSLYFIDAADSYQKGNTVARSPIPANQWFRFEMIVQGKRVRILVNDQQTTDFEDTEGLYTSGHLALQVYQGQSPVEFRKLEIKELGKTDWHGWPVDGAQPAIAPFDAAQAKKHQDAWAAYLGVQREYSNSLGMKFVLIPPGEFIMGSTAAEIEAALPDVGGNKPWEESIKSGAPRHRVILTQPIYLSISEVTQGQYEHVMGTNPSWFAKTGPGKQDVEKLADMDTTRFPVERVSWNDAAEFCAKLSEQETLKPFYARAGETVTPLAGTGYRLPSEAEWEMACRAGTTTRFWSGDQDKDLARAGWFVTNSGGRPHAVGELAPNPFGLYDMHGNLWEWVQDEWDATYYGQFSAKPAINPGNPPVGALRVQRGGDFVSSAVRCPSSFRVAVAPTFRGGTIGFRVALPVAAVKAALAGEPVRAIAPFSAAEARAYQDAWAKHLGVPRESGNSIGMKLVLLPPGEFQMGSSEEQVAAAVRVAEEYKADAGLTDAIRNTERPQHKVVITRPLLMGQTEVTIGQFKKFAAATGYQTGAEKMELAAKAASVPPPQNQWNGTYLSGLPAGATEDFPATHLTWNDAVAFCIWLSAEEKLAAPYEGEAGQYVVASDQGYHLPTEAQFEYACRAGTTSPYWFGDDPKRLADFAAIGQQKVGLKPPNAFGLYDMQGNAWEWCQDWFEEKWYEKSPATDPVGPASGTHRVLRGGFWRPAESMCRSAYRLNLAPTDGYFHYGFRVVRQAPPKLPPAGTRYALRFDGEKDVANVADFKFDGQPPLTIEGWLTPLRIDPDNFPVIDLGTGPHLGPKYKDTEWHGIFSGAGGPGGWQIANAPGLREANRRDHVAMTWDGTSIRCFVNGKGGEPVSLNAQFLPLRPKGEMAIGFGNSQGLVTEVRFSKVVRYTADFTPKERFESDDKTLALYHFDEGAGDVLRDDSGNHRHGTIVGAKWVLADGTPITNPPPVVPPPAAVPFNATQARAYQDAWAKHLGVQREHTNDLGMKFVLIPPGEFTMGGTPAEIDEGVKLAAANEHWQLSIKSESPRHPVILTQPFFLGVHEVTQAEYQQVMGQNPSHFAPQGVGKDAVAGLDTKNHPVEMVLWNDAADFCAKLSLQEKWKPFYSRVGETVTDLPGTGYRLPTEAEWEFACRAGTTTRFWFGDKAEDLPQADWFQTNAAARTHAVGELRANPFGLKDMHGNVWEWVQDGWSPTSHAESQGKPATDPKSPLSIGTQRVLRGGSWFYLAPYCYSPTRTHLVAPHRPSDIGFRVALTIDAVKAAIARKTASAAPQPRPTANVNGIEFPLDGLRGIQWKLASASGWNRAKKRPGIWRTGTATMSASDPKQLTVDPAGSELICTELADDLYTGQEFGDVRVELEFMLPQGSNSGVFLMGEYEVNCADDVGSGFVVGGPRATLQVRKPAGTWQSLDITFRAPRFDAEGRKTTDARLERVVYNGTVIHQNVSLQNVSNDPSNLKRREFPRGPLLLQGSLGPVAFRNLRLTPLDAPPAKP